MHRLIFFILILAAINMGGVMGVITYEIIQIVKEIKRERER